MSGQYGMHVRTILLITVNGEEPNAWGRWNYLWLDVTLLRSGLCRSPPRLSSTGVRLNKPSRRSGRKLPHTAELMLLPTVVQDHAEEATMDCQPAVVVIDEALLPELIHEMTDPRPGRADHLRQVFLIDSGNDSFGLLSFPK